MKLAIYTAFPAEEVALNLYGYHLVYQMTEYPEVSEIRVQTDWTRYGRFKSLDTPNKRLKVSAVDHPNSLGSFLRFVFNVVIDRPDAVFLNLRSVRILGAEMPTPMGFLGKISGQWLGIPTLALLHGIDTLTPGSSNECPRYDRSLRLVRAMARKCNQWLLASDVVVVTDSRDKEVLERDHKARNVGLVQHGMLNLLSMAAFTKQYMDFIEAIRISKLDDMEHDMLQYFTPKAGETTKI